MNLKGRWKGYYSYGAEHPLPQVAFEIEIVEDAAGKFKGAVQDGEGGHPMPGQIAGKSIGEDRIKFQKTMPAFAVALPEGGLQLLEGVGQKIDYYGRSDGPNAFEGTWANRSRFLWVRGSLVITRGNQGTWKMWRDS